MAYDLGKVGHTHPRHVKIFPRHPQVHLAAQLISMGMAGGFWMHLGFLEPQESLGASNVPSVKLSKESGKDAHTHVSNNIPLCSTCSF